METATVNWKVRLGTRTYFYNLSQTNLKDLLLINYTGKVNLVDTGLKVATPGQSYFDSLVFPEDPYDRQQVVNFLNDEDCKDMEHFEESLTKPGQKESFAMKKRLFTFVISNESIIADIVLTEIFHIYNVTPKLRYLTNYFELDMKQVFDNYERIMQSIKDVLGETMNEQEMKKEVNQFWAGVRLCHFLALENDETVLIKKGQVGLLSKYPFLDKSQSCNAFFDLKRGQALPNEILIDHIFLGNGKHVKHSYAGRRLEHHDPTGVYSCS